MKKITFTALLLAITSVSNIALAQTAQIPNIDAYGNAINSAPANIENNQAVNLPISSVNSNQNNIANINNGLDNNINKKVPINRNYNNPEVKQELRQNWQQAHDEIKQNRQDFKQTVQPEFQQQKSDNMQLRSDFKTQQFNLEQQVRTDIANAKSEQERQQIIQKYQTQRQENRQAFEQSFKNENQQFRADINQQRKEYNQNQKEAFSDFKNNAQQIKQENSMTKPEDARANFQRNDSPNFNAPSFAEKRGQETPRFERFDGRGMQAPMPQHREFSGILPKNENAGQNNDSARQPAQGLNNSVVNSQRGFNTPSRFEQANAPQPQFSRENNRINIRQEENVQRQMNSGQMNIQQQNAGQRPNFAPSAGGVGNRPIHVQEGRR